MELQKISQGFLEDARRAFGDLLKALCLFGSAARSEWIRKRSDLNFLLVLEEKGSEELEKAFGLVKRWSKKGVAIPLILTEEDIRRSLDVFPLEFLDMKLFHVTLFGEDPLHDLEIDRGALRLQCEREAKGKLLLLEEAYIATAGREKHIRAVVQQSIKAFLAIFQGALWLLGKDIPIKRETLIIEASRDLGLRGDPFLWAYRLKTGGIKPRKDELIPRVREYIKEVKRLSDWIDRYGEA